MEYDTTLDNIEPDPRNDAPTSAVENPAWRKERDALVAALDEEIREMTDSVEQQGEEIAKVFEAVQHYARLASSTGDPGSAAIALATVTRSFVAREMQCVQKVWDLQDKRAIWGD